MKYIKEKFYFTFMGKNNLNKISCPDPVSFLKLSNHSGGTNNLKLNLIQKKSNEQMYEQYAPVEKFDTEKERKKEGKKVFDFEGIYDERFPLISWKGFTRFKKGFGGIEVEYPGTLREIIL